MISRESRHIASNPISIDSSSDGLMSAENLIVFRTVPKTDQETPVTSYTVEEQPVERQDKSVLNPRTGKIFPIL